MTDKSCYPIDSAEYSKIRERLEHVWWVLHHSHDPERMAVALTCYFDESGTDTGSPIAVVGGVVLDMSQFYYLDIAWRKCLCAHHVPWPLHMREFGPRGMLKDWRSERRRALFTDVTKIINDNKGASIGARLKTAEYTSIFAGLSGFSIYGACFVLSTMMISVAAERAQYHDRIAYVLDNGNAYKGDILEAREVIQAKDEYAGAISFDSDTLLASLQVGDVIAWATRRKHAEGLKSGFEPLADLFDDKHLEAPYELGWMVSVADSLRAKMKK